MTVSSPRKKPFHPLRLLSKHFPKVAQFLLKLYAAAVAAFSAFANNPRAHIAQAYLRVYSSLAALFRLIKHSTTKLYSRVTAGDVSVTKLYGQIASGGISQCHIAASAAASIFALLLSWQLVVMLIGFGSAGQLAVRPNVALLDDRPAADWAISGKALTVAILNLPHNPLVNKHRIAKLAFLFITQKALPHQKLWARFFKGNEALYSVYVHAWEQSDAFNKGKAEQCFEGASIPIHDSARRQHALKHHMAFVDAQRRLLAWALVNPDNFFFVFISDSCIPLWNFTFVYDYVMKSKHSFVDVKDASTGGDMAGYHDEMAPLVPGHQYASGVPWGMALGRSHAAAVLGDTLFYKVFKLRCRAGRPAYDGSIPMLNGSDNETELEESGKAKGAKGRHSYGVCRPEHHYIPTFLNIVDGLGLLQRPVTFHRHKDLQRGANGASELADAPFRQRDVSPKVLGEIKEQRGYIRSPFEPELPCLVNGAKQPCFLFARPFLPAASQPLLRLSKADLSY